VGYAYLAVGLVFLVISVANLAYAIKTKSLLLIKKQLVLVINYNACQILIGLFKADLITIENETAKRMTSNLVYTAWSYSFLVILWSFFYRNWVTAQLIDGRLKLIQLAEEHADNLQVMIDYEKKLRQ
jgi:hypothetical protein